MLNIHLTLLTLKKGIWVVYTIVSDIEVMSMLDAL